MGLSVFAKAEFQRLVHNAQTRGQINTDGTPIKPSRTLKRPPPAGSTDDENFEKVQRYLSHVRARKTAAANMKKNNVPPPPPCSSPKPPEDTPPKVKQ